MGARTPQCCVLRLLDGLPTAVQGLPGAGRPVGGGRFLLPGFWLVQSCVSEVETEESGGRKLLVLSVTVGMAVSMRERMGGLSFFSSSRGQVSRIEFLILIQ